MNLGKLDFDGQTWGLFELKPHVSMRFKKMFGGIPEGSTPPFMLKDTPDRAVDLEWFMQRYPLEVTDRAAAALSTGIAIHGENRQRLETLTRPGYKPLLKNHFREGEAPFDYQLVAAEMARATGRLLLMDDVGLGKTVSALAAISDGRGLPAAIVVQPHLSGQWIKKYIQKFTDLKAHEIKDRNVRDLPPADVYVFRYSNIAAWSDYAETLGCKTVIFDEIQELRHGLSTSKGYGARAFAASAEMRIGLTATPIYNYGSEMFNVVEFIAPGALGSWHEFIVNWCVLHGNHWVVKEPDALGAFLADQGITLRRDNESPEVSGTLPPLYKTLFQVEWNAGDAATDRELQLQLAQRVVSGDWHARGIAARQLDLLLRLETGVAKARSVAAYVRTLIEGGDSVLLGGWHRAVYDIWLQSLDDLKPVMFTGSETAKQKASAEREFTSGQSPLMIMSLRSGAGLDGLQFGCETTVFGEFDWSPQVHKQFTGRLRRYGQTEAVTAHYLWTDGGSDPVIMDTLGLKSSQSQGILNPYGGSVEGTEVNGTRMRALAKKVLESKE